MKNWKPLKYAFNIALFVLLSGLAKGQYREESKGLSIGVGVSNTQLEFTNSSGGNPDKLLNDFKFSNSYNPQLTLSYEFKSEGFTAAPYLMANYFNAKGVANWIDADNKPQTDYYQLSALNFGLGVAPEYHFTINSTHRFIAGAGVFIMVPVYDKNNWTTTAERSPGVSMKRTPVSFLQAAWFRPFASAKYYFKRHGLMFQYYLRSNFLKTGSYNNMYQKGLSLSYLFRINEK